MAYPDRRGCPGAGALAVRHNHRRAIRSHPVARRLLAVRLRDSSLAPSTAGFAHRPR